MVRVGKILRKKSQGRMLSKKKMVIGQSSPFTIGKSVIGILLSSSTWEISYKRTVYQRPNRTGITVHW